MSMLSKPVYSDNDFPLASNSAGYTYGGDFCLSVGNNKARGYGAGAGSGYGAFNGEGRGDADGKDASGGRSDVYYTDSLPIVEARA